MFIGLTRQTHIYYRPSQLWQPNNYKQTSIYILLVQGKYLTTTYMEEGLLFFVGDLKHDGLSGQFRLYNLWVGLKTACFSY